MTDHASYIAGPDADDDLIMVVLSDGRTLGFADYEYTRAHAGSFDEPPTPAEATVRDAWWVSPDGTETPATNAELDDLHDGPEYDAILAACEDAEAKLRAVDIDDGIEEFEP